MIARRCRWCPRVFAAKKLGDLWRHVRADHPKEFDRAGFEKGSRDRKRAER